MEPRRVIHVGCLKNPVTMQTTIAVVEILAKMRELSRTIGQLSEVYEKDQQKALVQSSGKDL